MNDIKKQTVAAKKFADKLIEFISGETGKLAKEGVTIAGILGDDRHLILEFRSTDTNIETFKVMVES